MTPRACRVGVPSATALAAYLLCGCMTARWNAASREVSPGEFECLYEQDRPPSFAAEYYNFRGAILGYSYLECMEADPRTLGNTFPTYQYGYSVRTPTSRLPAGFPEHPPRHLAAGWSPLTTVSPANAAPAPTIPKRKEDAPRFAR